MIGLTGIKFEVSDKKYPDIELPNWMAGYGKGREQIGVKALKHKI